MDLAIFYRFSTFTVIPTGKIGLILAKDGAELETGRILGRKVECDSSPRCIFSLIMG